MSIDLNVGMSAAEKHAENEELLRLYDTSEQLLGCYEMYIDESRLCGNAYGTHKEYFEYMQIPTLKGIIEFCDIMSEANNKYVDVVTTYFDGMHINDELWDAILTELKIQYNALIAHYESSVLASMPGFGYDPYTAYGTVYGEDTYLIDSIKDEINVLYTVIQEYEDRLSKLNEMNEELYGVYYHAKILQESVQAAVDALGRIVMTTDGNYYLDCVDRSVFEKLSNDIVAIDVAERVREQLGEDILLAYAKGELTDEDEQNLMLDIAQALADCSLSVDKTIGHVEIPIAPGITGYFEARISTDLNYDEIKGLDISIDENRKKLASVDISMGMFEGKIGENQFGLGFKKELDDNLALYGEILYSVAKAETTLEIGIETLLVDLYEIDSDVTVTTATGVELSLVSSDWEIDNKEESSNEEVEAPNWEVSVEKQDEDSMVEDIHPIQAHIVTEFGYVQEGDALGTTSSLVALGVHAMEGNYVGVIWSLLDFAH